MKRVLLLGFLALSSSGLAAETYGDKFSGQAPSIKLTDAATLVKQSKKLVSVTGKVEKVCEKKGCWMTLNDGTANMMIRFKDYSFFVPLKLKGKKVMAEGYIQEKTRSVKEQRHYAKDAGASQAEIDKIKSEKTVFEFIAHAVKTI